MIDLWRLYNENLESPDIFIDFGFYSLVSACLGRKVWLGQDFNKTHLNTYTVFVGPPGVGKGRVIKRIKDLLRCVEVNDKIQYDVLTKLPEISNMAVPLAPEELTKPRLVTIMSKLGSVAQLDNGTILPHASIMVCLDELSSLLKAWESDKTVDLLIELYDCDPYTASTQSRKDETIFNGCLTILAGTNPAFMQQCHETYILRTGFSARCWFIYADKPRKMIFQSGKLEEHHLKARRELLKFVNKLSKLTGVIRLSNDALTFLTEWYEHDFNREVHNRSAKLADYFARKRLHVQKLAALRAISENQSLVKEVSVRNVQEAFRDFKTIEKTMDLAFASVPRNPIASVKPAIVDLLSNEEPITLNELYAHVGETLNLREFVEAIKTVSKQHGIAFLDIGGTLKLSTNKEVVNGKKRFSLFKVEEILKDYETKV